MTRDILLIAGFSFLSVTHVVAQNTGKEKIVVIENKKVATTRNSCTEPATNPDFFDFFKHLKAHNGFDSEKLREAKLAVTNSCFTSKQIKITLTAFKYDAARIEFAKFAYSYVYDRPSYREIKGGFINDDSWEQVEEYIKHE